MVNIREISCNKYIVAVIDILGAKKLIMSMNQNSSLQDMHFVYDFLLLLQNNKKDFNIKIYSDNVVIAQLIQEEQDEILLSTSIHNLFKCVAEYQWHLLNLGYLSRGGVALGDFYIDETIVWGKALVQAHEMEEKRAVFPRVLIHEDIINLYSRISDETSMVIKDTDGFYFIDYLTYNLDCELSKFPYILDMIKKQANTIQDAHIKEKYEWYEKYHQKIFDNYDTEAWRLRWENIIADLT